MLDEILDYLKKDKSIKIIHLKRKNYLDIIISSRIASSTGKWQITSKKEMGDYEPIWLDYKECLDSFKKINKYEIIYDDFFKDHPLINITYEDLLKNLDYELNRIQKFLGLDIEVLASPLKKQNHKKPVESIINYQELKEKFSRTKWYYFFKVMRKHC